MALSKELTFKAISNAVSYWYDQNSCLTMLKVLIRDHVTDNNLAGMKDTTDFLTALVNLKLLSSTNLDIIADIIRITRHFGLQVKIKEIYPSFPDVKEEISSPNFTHYRQKIMKFGMTLTPTNVRQIDGMYNAPLKNYSEGWVMITDLEQRGKLSEENMNEFTTVLNILRLRLALDALTKDIQDSPLDITTEGASNIPGQSLEKYKMTSVPCGICLIINNMHFTKSEFRDLKGYKHDEESLKNVFKHFKFNVEIRRDLSAGEIMSVIMQYSQHDHTKYDCFVCCILSHGNQGVVFGVDGVPVGVSLISSPFRSTNCKSLCNKPKLFFIQACRGDQTPEYAISALANSPTTDDVDFLFGYSTVLGNQSFVYLGHGSPYIQALTKTLEEESGKGKDIQYILTRVNNKVSGMTIYVWDNPLAEIPIVPRMQIPAPLYTLTKTLIFSPRK